MKVSGRWKQLAVWNHGKQTTLIQTAFGGDGGVHQNITHATNPDPISGAHCWLQKVSISNPEPGEKYGDIFVDTNKSFEHFKKWNEWAKARETHPDGLRRPLWMARPLNPQLKNYYL